LVEQDFGLKIGISLSFTSGIAGDIKWVEITLIIFE
tara:strand:+ start:580 stop:687 length:108 start_codon:yes stop_codon:yes gene_type:complete